MRIILLLLLGLMVAACDSPHPKMYGEEVTRITVEHSTFKVRTKGDIGEAIRIGYAPRSEHPRIILRAVVAIEKVSGCKVDQRSVRGDPALVIARIKCPKPASET